MTYSLNTLNHPRTGQSGRQAQAGEGPIRSGLQRFATELFLIGGFVALTIWLLALFTYSTQDAAWSTSGSGGALANRAGKLGALVADVSYFAFGFSVWWCVAAMLRAWLATLARWMRGHELPARLSEPDHNDSQTKFHALLHKLTSPAAKFWIGLLLLLCASVALEWSRLYRLEAHLPGHAGGVLGFWLGPLALKWLGFTGSGLVAIALVVAGFAMAFRFSWGHAAERIGGWLYTLIESRRAKREIAEDLALGQQAARERQETVVEEREVIAELHSMPMMIEPLVVDVPKSERVAKERQKPLFTELPRQQTAAG